jgi:UDP-2,3-diacylglucosamine pyrophosphatase LpxH
MSKNNSKSREQLLQYLIENEGKPKGQTWLDLAKLFGVRKGGNDSQRTKAANDIWRIFKKQNPAKSQVTTISETVMSIPTGMKVKKMWQGGKGGELRYSYEAVKATENYEDISSAIKESIKDYIPLSLSKELTSLKEDYCYILSFTDLHFGKEPIEDTKKKLFESLKGLLQDAQPEKGSHFKIIIGNDLLNSDTVGYTTTKGTPQFDHVEWKDSYVAAYQAMLDVINIINDNYQGTIEVINIPGNHDYMKGFTVGEVIKGFFHNFSNITVNNQNEDRKYSTWGKNLWMFDHGELKASQYPLLMATEKPKLWGEAINREVFCGHLHHIKDEEYPGVLIRFLPSLCRSDAWHQKRGYISKKRAQLFKYNKTGLQSMHQYNM